MDWLTLDELQTMYQTNPDCDLLKSLNKSANDIKEKALNSDVQDYLKIMIKGSKCGQSGRIIKYFAMNCEEKHKTFRSLKELEHAMFDQSTRETTITMVHGEDADTAQTKKRKVSHDISNETIYNYLKRIDRKLDDILSRINEEEEEQQELDNQFIDDTENDDLDPDTRKELNAICSHLSTGVMKK